MSLPHRILSVAPYCCLLSTREEIFKSAGYAVTSVPTTSDALRTLSATGDAFDILVVCDCTPADERGQLVASLKVTSPDIPVLVIGKRGEKEFLTDDEVGRLDGPEALLNHISALLAAKNTRKRRKAQRAAKATGGR